MFVIDLLHIVIPLHLPFVIPRLFFSLTFLFVCFYLYFFAVHRLVWLSFFTLAYTPSLLLFSLVCFYSFYSLSIFFLSFFMARICSVSWFQFLFLFYFFVFNHCLLPFILPFIFPSRFPLASFFYPISSLALWGYVFLSYTISSYPFPIMSFPIPKAFVSFLWQAAVDS